MLEFKIRSKIDTEMKHPEQSFHLQCFYFIEVLSNNSKVFHPLTYQYKPKMTKGKGHHIEYVEYRERTRNRLHPTTRSAFPSPVYLEIERSKDIQDVDVERLIKRDSI